MRIIKFGGPIILLIALLFCMSGISAAADAYSPDKVIDNAGLLSDSEEAALRQKIAGVINAYKCDIVVLTVHSTQGKTPMVFADDYFDEHIYGMGKNQDGILLLVSMQERDWYLSTKGSAIHTFTDYGIQKIGGIVADYLGDGNYAEGFNRFVSLCDEFLKQAAAGEPFDVNNKYKEPKTAGDYTVYLLISLGIGAVVAFIVTATMKSKLKTAVPQLAANAYIKNGSVNITNSKDLFLYFTLSRTARPKDTGGGGRGGSSVHTSSSGSSHGGGGGKF